MSENPSSDSPSLEEALSALSFDQMDDDTLAQIAADLERQGAAFSDAPPVAAATPTPPAPAPAPAPAAPLSGSIDHLLDVEMDITAELGRVRLSVRDLLALGPGSLTVLDRLAGEPIDVAVNGTLVARGEVVVVEEKYGIRLTEIISRAARSDLGA